MNQDVALWNKDWLKSKFTKQLLYKHTCNEDRLPTKNTIIVFNETRSIYEMKEELEPMDKLRVKTQDVNESITDNLPSMEEMKKIMDGLF